MNIDKVREFNQEFISHNKTLVYYIRDKHGNRIGCTVAYKDGNEVKVGWSKCKIKCKSGDCDKFHKDVGLFIAINRAIPVNTRILPDCTEQPKEPEINSKRKSKTKKIKASDNSYVYLIPQSIYTKVRHMRDRGKAYFKMG